MPQNVRLQKGIAYSQLSPGDVELYAPSRSLSLDQLTLLAILQLSHYDAIVGDVSAVGAGLAQYTSVQSAINALSDGQRLLILPGTYTEAISLNKRLFIDGQGYDSFVDGTITCGTSCDYSQLRSLRFGTLTFAAGANGNILLGCFFTTAPTDSGTGNAIAGCVEV